MSERKAQKKRSLTFTNAMAMFNSCWIAGLSRGQGALHGRGRNVYEHIPRGVTSS